MSARSLFARVELGAGALLVVSALYIVVRVLQLGQADPHGILYWIAFLAAGLGILLILAGLALRGRSPWAWLVQLPALLWGGAVLAYVLR